MTKEYILPNEQVGRVFQQWPCCLEPMPLEETIWCIVLNDIHYSFLPAGSDSLKKHFLTLEITVLIDDEIDIVVINNFLQ